MSSIGFSNICQLLSSIAVKGLTIVRKRGGNMWSNELKNENLRREILDRKAENYNRKERRSHLVQQSLVAKWVPLPSQQFLPLFAFPSETTRHQPRPLKDYEK